MNFAVTPQSRTRKKSPSVGIFNPAAASLIVVGCLAGALLLVPKDTELVERLIDDGQHHRALDIVQNSSGHEDLKQELIEVVEATPDLATVTLSPGIDAKAALEEALVALGSSSGAVLLTDMSPLAQAVASVRAVRDVGSAAAMVAAADRGDSALPSEARIEIYRAMGIRAVADDNAPLAVGIYATFRGAGTMASDGMLGEMMDAAGFAGQPEVAVAIVEDHCEAALITIADLPAPFREKAVQMLRAANRPSKALDVLIAELEKEAASIDGIQTERLQVAIETAGHADRSPEMIPFLSAFVNKLPAARRSWEQTLSLAEQGQLRLGDDYRRYAKLLARCSEWTNRYPEAFDCYLRLAIAEDREAFDRAADLYDDLNRQHDFMLLLRQVVPVEDGETYTRRLAYLFGDSGFYEESEQRYREWLATHQTDVGAWLELGALLEEKADYEGALATFLEAARLMEKDAPKKRLPLLKQIASLQIGLRDFKKPFKFYDALDDDEHDAVTLENYALIAESMAQYEAYNRALFLRHERLRKPRTEDFIELARSFAMIEDRINSVRTLREGLSRIPESKQLHIELANALREAGQNREAYRLLAKPALRKNMRAMGILIEIASALENYREAVRFLGRGIEREFAFSPDIRLDLGHIYEGAGRLRDAERLYASVPDSPHTWPLLASARFKRGDYASAEVFQKKHLESLSVPDPEGWMFLGDILRNQGKESAAENAYLRSLRLMESKIEINDRPRLSGPNCGLH